MEFETVSPEETGMSAARLVKARQNGANPVRN